MSLKHWLMVSVFSMGVITSVFAGHNVFYCPQEYEKHILTWSGMITVESWFDTRQNKTKRSGNELLFPEKKILTKTDMILMLGQISELFHLWHA